MKQGDIPAFQVSGHKEMNFEIVAASDIWKIAPRRRCSLHPEGSPAIPIDAVVNNEALYSRNDIDAVLIATADFQHAQHGIQAVQAGCDAYVEKPTAHTMADAREVGKAVENSKQIIAVGTQRRSTPAYIKGRVHQVRQVRRHRHGRDDLER